MRTNEIIGYRVLHLPTEGFVHGYDILKTESAPVARGQAYRRLAGALDENPGMEIAEFSVEPVYRETTPIEDVTNELSTLLTSLCERHGVKLGLTSEQIKAKLAEELKDFGVYTPDVISHISR